MWIVIGNSEIVCQWGASCQGRLELMLFLTEFQLSVNKKNTLHALNRVSVNIFCVNRIKIRMNLFCLGETRD